MEKTKKKRKINLTAIIFIEVFILVLLLVGGKIYDSVGKIQKDDSKDHEIIQNEEVEPETGYRNIVLFGVDSRENTLKEGTNSDTIIIASINNKTKEVRLVSIYRDTYSNIPGEGYDKINAAYRIGGYSLAISTINTNFDLDIKEYVTVNFLAVVKVIDELGGITLDITEEELPYLNGYVHELNKINDSKVPDLKNYGKQHVNGTQATAYARIRYTSGGDFKRTERQRIVIGRIFEKVKSSKLSTINALINEFFPQVSTNLGNLEILNLAKSVFSYHITDQTGFPFETDIHNYKRVSYVFPVALDANVKKLHKFLFDEPNYTPSKKVREYSEKIEAVRND
ncbi:MAG: hypothetical protein K0S76_2577 [Herbinix sp.]|jgi:LCP family protein required for cell wall assembly|nr:hypothetical protein [Herbinix sp.]